jgi:hypothetical protein
MRRRYRLGTSVGRRGAPGASTFGLGSSAIVAKPGRVIFAALTWKKFESLYLLTM